MRGPPVLVRRRRADSRRLAWVRSVRRRSPVLGLVPRAAEWAAMLRSASVALPDAFPVLVFMKSPARITCIARNEAARMLS